MAILQTSDFSTGQFSIPNDKFSQLGIYITKFERHYLLKLLGNNLYDSFIADLTASTPQVPQTAIYITIFNEFHIEMDGVNNSSEGIKEMLKQFIYFHFMRDAAYKKTPFGVTTGAAENATNSVYQGFNLIESFNQGVDNSIAIQWYIQDNMTDYPTFLGGVIEYSSGI